MNSRTIASIGTILIHLLLFGLLGIQFSGEESAQLSDAELDNIELQMENVDTEDVPTTPPGKDPTSEQKDKASESISKGKAQPKASASTPEPATAPANDEMHEAIIDPADTIIKRIEKKDIVQITKPDTLKEMKRDSILLTNLMEKAQMTPKNKADNERYRKDQEKFQFYKKNFRNVYNFKKVYPYALKTKEIMDNVNKQLSTMTDESEKKKLIKETEKTLFKEYEKAVRSMSTSQGKLLLKLIARETNKTGYQIIKDYKGSFPATFWYGVGKIFGTDLKTEFHKEKEDSIIETILTKYKSGDLY